MISLVIFRHVYQVILYNLPLTVVELSHLYRIHIASSADLLCLYLWITPAINSWTHESLSLSSINSKNLSKNIHYYIPQDVLPGIQPEQNSGLYTKLSKRVFICKASSQLVVGIVWYHTTFFPPFFSVDLIQPNSSTNLR